MLPLLPGQAVDLGQVSAPVSTCSEDLASVVTSVTIVLGWLMLVAWVLIATTAVVRASRAPPSAIAVLVWAAVASELGTRLMTSELGRYVVAVVGPTSMLMLTSVAEGLRKTRVMVSVSSPPTMMWSV